MTKEITLNEALSQEIGETQSPVNTNVRDESFYLERFKACVADRGYSNHGRIVDTNFRCEIHKGFAIVTWEQEWDTPTKGVTRTTYNSYVWEVGGVFDHLTSLAWISQGCVTTGYNSTNHEQAIKKARKKVDLLSEVYSHKSELQGLSQIYRVRGSGFQEPVYNALIGDVVAIRAFGRTRLGKIVKLIGSRFVVAYMTPSNSHDVHYKTLPLSQIYPKD